jgi:hypothetical protein
MIADAASMRTGLQLLTAVIAIAATCASASAATSAHAIALLNAERARDGLPAQITDVPSLDASCAAHDRYMQLNHVLQHTEDDGRPGYSEAGSEAGGSSVLSQGGTFDLANPWENAPIHLDQLLNPTLASTGYADTVSSSRGGVYACMNTLLGQGVFPVAPGSIFTVPHDGQTQVGRTTDASSEAPTNPAKIVGLTSSVTGLNMYVYAPGPVSQATLAGPSGPVAVRVYSSADPTWGSYIGTGGILVPTKALRPAASYTATISGVGTTYDDTLGSIETPYTLTWTFRTAADNVLGIDVVRDSSNGRTISLRIRTPAPTVEISYRQQSSPAMHVMHRATRGGSVAVTLRPTRAHGRLYVCASSGDATTGDYPPASACSRLDT